MKTPTKNVKENKNVSEVNDKMNLKREQEVRNMRRPLERLHLVLGVHGEAPASPRGQEEAGGCAASAERGPGEPPSLLLYGPGRESKALQMLKVRSETVLSKGLWSGGAAAPALRDTRLRQCPSLLSHGPRWLALRL